MKTITLSIPVARIPEFKDACKAKFLTASYNANALHAGVSQIFVEVSRSNSKELSPQTVFSLGVLFNELCASTDYNNELEFEVASSK